MALVSLVARRSRRSSLASLVARVPRRSPLAARLKLCFHRLLLLPRVGQDEEEAAAEIYVAKASNGMRGHTAFLTFATLPIAEEEPTPAAIDAKTTTETTAAQSPPPSAPDSTASS